jgi:4'-phosphopantetheinyl transferase
LEVEVVRAHLGDVPDLSRFRELLAPDERARADAYRIEEARNLFTLARGLLRLELAKRLGGEPGDIEFDQRPSGKPDLRPPLKDRPDWRFSVSHTGSHVALAFSLGTDVGIDIELTNREVKPMTIATRYFTETEVAALQALTEEERPRAFFAGWTRKEAIVKARGVTMAESLKTLSVGLDPNELHPSSVDSFDAPARALCRLTTFEFEALKLIGAVAVCAAATPHLRFEVFSGTRFD